MAVAGTIQLTLDIHNLKTLVTFNVINVLMHDAILGLDFLTQTEANIDFSSRVLTLYDDLVGVNLTKSSDVVLKTIDAVVIPPKFEAAIPVSVPARHGSVLSIVEPSVTLNQKHLALAKALVVLRGNRTICKILNPTDSHIFLRRRTTIGVIEKISIDSINVINDPNPEIETDRSQPESTGRTIGGHEINRNCARTKRFAERAIRKVGKSYFHEY